MAITDAAGDSTSYTYDENGNVTQANTTQVPTAGGSETFVTQLVYDELNRLVTRKEMDRTSSTNILQTGYQYDSRGNLTFLVDAEGHPTRWTYDLAGRLTQRERALSVGSSIDTFVTEIQESFAYDKDDRLTSLVDDNYQATTYAMDALKRARRPRVRAASP
jgi:YD repeat-containing protein